MPMELITFRLPHLLLLLAALAATGGAQAETSNLADIYSALQAGQADRALALTSALPEGGADSAEARNLECRVRFTLQQWDAAARACDQAVRLDQQNSDYHMWLGRALGEKAGRASFLSAYSLGKQVRAQFEQAVQLDPRNPAALSDLGSFYMEAPGVMGGGLDKAEKVAEQLDGVSPGRAHQLRAEMAEQRKDYGTAEQELKAAIAASPHPALEWTALGSFYEHRQRWPEMESAIEHSFTAAERDRSASVALYDGAGVLIRSKQDSALAAKMLERYLGGESMTEEGPAFVAHLRLAKLKQELGDDSGAEHERSVAFAMAREYHPAQE
jgi:tetratricopeptide (TPR) repeat protein